MAFTGRALPEHEGLHEITGLQVAREFRLSQQVVDPQAEIVATLIEEANRIAAEMGPDAPLGTAQVVTA